MSHGGGGDNPYTRGIAQFVAGVTHERIPAEVIARLKLLILDSLGCALYGAELPWSRILIATLGGLDRTIDKLVARGVRFYLLAFLLNRYGAQARAIIEERLGLWVTVGAVVLVAGIVAAVYLLFVLDEKGHTVHLTDRGVDFMSPSDHDAFVLPDISHEVLRIDKDESMTPQQKIDVVKQRLIKQFGYNETSATDVLNYVASMFARGDSKQEE